MPPNPRRAQLPATAVASALLAAVAVACGTGNEPAPSGGDLPAPTAATACADVQTLEAVPALHPSVDGYPSVVVALAPPDGSCVIELPVRHADTQARRAHGLMQVPALPAGTGMLFSYPDVTGERTGGYWMKDTLVPLDIAYIDGDGTIVDIRQMEPCDEAALAEGERCPSYPPDRPYRAALEVPRGWFADVGVREGWTVVARS